MDRLIPAASALIICRGKILLVRSKTTHEKWAFPGGRQEEGETSQVAATREVKEELGMDIEIGRKLGSYVSVLAKRKYEIECFVAEARSFDFIVNPNEIIEAAWCTLKEAVALNLTSTTRQALEKYTSQYHDRDSHPN